MKFYNFIEADFLPILQLLDSSIDKQQTPLFIDLESIVAELIPSSQLLSK